MSEEIEVPLEKIQQDLEHEAHQAHENGGHHPPKSNWITWSALLSAILAVAAAVAALQAGHHANEAMMDQIQASDTWAFYQAKGIKAAIVETRAQILEGLGRPPAPGLSEKIAGYAKDQKELQEKAREHEEGSHTHFHRHETFATSVTFFQIAIAVTAIAVLAKRRKFLFVSGVFGVLGLVFLIQGFLANIGSP